MDLPLPARLLALWDHLGLGAAHVATQMPADLAGFANAAADRVAGLVLCTPTRLDPAPFAGLAGRILMIAGEHGLNAEVTARAEQRLPGARRTILAGYDAPGWADVVADRTDEIAASMEEFFARLPAADPPRPPSRSGAHAGITYAIECDGPALVLLPFFLAPSQWAPAIPHLTQHFT